MSKLSSTTTINQEMDYSSDQSDLLDTAKILQEYQELNKKIDQTLYKIKHKKKK